jgi:hypothetical protein
MIFLVNFQQKNSKKMSRDETENTTEIKLTIY